MKSRISLVLAFFFLLMLVGPASSALTGFVKMQNGYFYDSGAGQPWVPHGIAYQTWNRPLGVWQTFDQIDYDLDEMKKMGANSIRVDFVWQHIEEKGDNIWSWTNYDYLVSACEKRDMRIFALIGYQWPPNWFPDSLYTMHPPETDAEGIVHTNRWQSDIIGYETPAARAQYAQFFSNVCARYKNSKAIAAWIVGNEYGYLGLWSGLLDGYDPNCEAAFRTWCQAKYTTISNVNAAWGTSFAAFSNIVFVEQYRAYGKEGAEWADMVQWREDSIANYTALGARAAKSADTNHLISYSTVGMQWGEEDWRYHAEDRGKITAACAATNAPIDFFSVNNYPWSVLGHESQNGQWGISYTKKVAGVPVLYTETGFTSSETMWPGMNEVRQGPLVRNALWESLQSGAIGTHIFSWMDRPWITDREKGFGVVYADRNIKPAFWVSRDAYGLMEQVKIHELLAGSQDPKPDIAFLWTAANDSQYNRYECEMQQIAGALERLGYEPNFLNLNDLASGAYTNYKVIILPRNMRVDNAVPGYTNSVLNFLLKQVAPKGIHIMASADLPGLQDFNGKPRAPFAKEVSELFGINADDIGGVEAPMRRRHYVSDDWNLIEVDFTTNAVGAVAGAYHYWPYVWKYSDEITLTNGGVLWATMNTLRNKGFEDSSTQVMRWDGIWGDVYVRSGWGWAYDGNNMVQMWGDSGMYKDFPVVPFGRYTHSAFLRSNNDDPLRNGKQAYVAIEWRDEAGTLLQTSESAHLATNTPGNSWVRYSVDAVAPSNAFTGRRIIRITGAGEGSVYVDNRQLSPAVVVKSLGAAKSAIFLYSAGDMKPDGDLDGQPDTYNWKWRYEVFGSVIRDYFGVQPKLQLQGTNACYAIADYRTCTNGATLWQIKNYLYNTSLPNGGAPQTFTLQSSLLTGKTVRAFEQGRILATNCSGTVQVTLAPDGHEMLMVYAPGTNRAEIVQIADAPAVVHPFGDKVYQVRVKFDCRNTTGLKLKAAFMENGDNGDGLTNEIYSVLTNAVTGAGETNFWIWIPDYNTTHPDYKSTPDGGKYQFAAWLENGSSVKIAEALPMATILEWGLRPTNALPATVTKGQAVSVPIEWEDLYEQLFWQNTPLTRNQAYPTRVAVFRSSKTEAQFPGHFTKVNEVADWLESRGYTNGNLLDISFDNVKVNTTFTDNFEDGNYTGWTRAAGCANWTVTQSVTGSVTGAVGYWKMDEASWTGGVNQVLDSSGRLCHGTPYGGAKTTNDARVTRAGWFDGSNDYVQVTNRPVLQACSNLTLSFWIKGSNLGSKRVNPLDKNYGGEFSLTIETNRSLNFYHGYSRTSGQYMGWAALPANSLTNNSWSHVVITRTRSTRALKSYLNGVLKSSYTYATNMQPAASTNSIRIGLGYTGLGFGGVLDEVKVCTSAWTTNDVAREYTYGVNRLALRASRIGNSDNILLSANTYTNTTLSADIRYNKQDNYFNDAELYFRYKDRNNFCKVGIKNYYGFWRLKYTVRVRTNVFQQGWICDFPKTNRPVENVWYNLKVESFGGTNKVYVNGQLKGTFWDTNFPSGKIGVGGSAAQLGIWEPQKGYYFIDDDEYSFWAPEGSAQLSGKPLNLDWGYLQGFYNTLILPSVYVMSDIEVSNVCTWITNGLNSLIGTDGSIAMKNESGAYDLGRIEKLFGVGPTLTTLTNATRVTIGSEDHYVTLDYKAGNAVTVSGTARPWTTLTTGKALAIVSNAASVKAPALIANTITNNSAAPAKAFCFNFAADSGTQLKGNLKTLAQRAFEWTRGQAFKVRLELKYQVNPAWPNGDLVLASTTGWLLAGSGTNTLIVNIPADGIMTGTNLYWAGYVYPWDAADPWALHAGFFATANDGVFSRLAGKGLQIQGTTEKAFAGRAWDMWAAYNTTGQPTRVVFGIKDKGAVNAEDNFDDGDFAGWNVVTNNNIRWSVTNRALRASVVSTGGYSYIYRNALGLGVTNITFECDARFMNGARHGGLIYRGRVCYVNPQMCGWADNTPNYYTNNTGVTTGKWQYVVLNVRDGSPYMRSDLFVDGKAIFLDEPIETTSWTTNTVGFLSPYYPGYLELDNVRVADEQYVFSTQTVNGVYFSTNTAAFWPFIPDYDPARWEHEGTAMGAQYEWYVYMRGDGLHSFSNVNVYFAPRLCVEATNFPVRMNPGQTVNVPVEWEQLPTNVLPARLCVSLQDPWTGKTQATNIFTITTSSGASSYAVALPMATPAGSNYLWSAYIYPSGAANPWLERIGADDTYRHGADGIGIEPETLIQVTSGTGTDFRVFSDAGIPPDCDIYTWAGATAIFNGHYTGEAPPEGLESYQSVCADYAGWGVMRLTGTMSLAAYSNGYLKFSIKSKTSQAFKVQIEAPQGTQRTVYVTPSAGAWQNISIAATNFSGANFSQVYSPFLITSPGYQSTSNLVDNVRWSLTP